MQVFYDPLQGRRPTAQPALANPPATPTTLTPRRVLDKVVTQAKIVAVRGPPPGLPAPAMFERYFCFLAKGDKW